MKLNLGKRIVLFIHWLFSLAACVIAAIYCIKPDIMWNSFEMVYAQIGKRQTDIIGIACLAVYVILSVATVIIILANKEKREQRTFIIVDASETGRTRIAVSAVDQMIRQAVRGMEEIKTMKSSISNLGDAIAIDADVTIADGAHIPSVTAAIQRSVRSYIELNCGVSVKSVCVNVRAVEQTVQKGKHAAKNSVVKPYEPTPAAEIKTPEPEMIQPEIEKEVMIEEPAHAADTENTMDGVQDFEGENAAETDSQFDNNSELN